MTMWLITVKSTSHPVLEFYTYMVRVYKTRLSTGKSDTIIPWEVDSIVTEHTLQVSLMATGA